MPLRVVERCCHDLFLPSPHMFPSCETTPSPYDRQPMLLLALSLVEMIFFWHSLDHGRARGFQGSGVRVLGVYVYIYICIYIYIYTFFHGIYIYIYIYIWYT